MWIKVNKSKYDRFCLDYRVKVLERYTNGEDIIYKIENYYIAYILTPGKIILAKSTQLKNFNQAKRFVMNFNKPDILKLVQKDRDRYKKYYSKFGEKN